MATPDVKVTIGADDSAFVTTLRNMQAEGQAAAAHVKESFEGVKSTFESVSTALVAFTAVLAGGRAFKEMIDATVQTNFAAQELGRQMGITATQAGVLRLAMDDNFVSTEQMETATAKITTTLRKNEEAFGRLGVATRQANGEYRGTFEIMQDVNAALAGLKEGTDRNVEGQIIYGKGWKEVERSILITKESMAEAAKTAEELNLTVSKEGVEATNRYKRSLKEAHDVVDGIYKTIGDVLMPVLTQLAEWFRSVGPKAIEVVKQAIAKLIIVFSALKNTVEIVFDGLMLVVEEFLGVVDMLIDSLNAVIHLDFAGAKAAWASGWDQLKSIAASRINDMKGHADDFSSTFGDAMDSANSKNGGTPTNEPNGKHSNFDDGKAAKKDAAAARELARENAERERVLAAAWAQARKIEDINFETTRDIALNELAVEEENARSKYQMHELSLAQYVAQLREFENRKYALQVKALADEIELAKLDPTADPAKVAQMYSSLEKLASIHNLAMAKINSFAAAEAGKGWKGFFTSLSSSFESAIQRMFTTTQSFGGHMRSLFTSMTGAIAQSFIGMAAKNISTMLAQAAVGKGIRMKEIYGDAKKAASGAYAAIAGIPYVGPFLAPAAAAAAFAGTIAFASAEGGYDIPGGVNPVVQAHAREMVLPEKQADAIRNLANGQGGGVTVQIKATPMKGGYFVTEDNLLDHVRRLHRGGALLKI